MKIIPRDWHVHGRFAQTELMAGVLPRQGTHYLAGSDVQAKDAIIADIATATASDVTVCGLSAPDKNGARSSLSSFFGLGTGAATGVAIMTSAERADALSRSIAAAALARGINRQLPIAVLGVGGVSAQHLTGAHARVAELAEWMQAEHGVSLGIVVLDLALPHGELNAFKRPDRAVLVAGDAAPAALDGVVIEAGDGRLTLAKPAQGEPSWAREFALDVVSVEGVDALTVRHGKPVTPTPIWQAAKKPAARKAKDPEPEVQIVSKVVVLHARGEPSPALRNKWTLQGFEIARDADASLPKPGEVESGKRLIMIAGDGDQRHEDLKSVANQLHWKAVERSVAGRVKIEVAA